MSKKILVICLAMFMVLTLTACGECEHEWTEADCLNAAVCTKCEAAGEAALGHDFTAASCDAPETCIRCGEIQGEALGHDYGDWTFSKTEKTRSCTRCAQTESEEIDEATYAGYLMNGHWDTYYMIIEGQDYTAYDLKDGVIPPYINVTGDAFQFYSSGEIYNMTLEYLEYYAESNLYYFTGHFDDGGEVGMWLIDIDGVNYVYMYFDDGYCIVFSQYTQEKAITASSWACAKNGTVYTVTLNEDGTFTADWGEEITGIWQMMPTGTSGSAHIGGCKLCYEKDGQWIVLDGEFYYSYGDEINWEQAAYGASLYVTPNEEIGYLSFDRLENAEDVDSLKTAMAEGKDKAVGTWNSKTLSVYSQDSNTTEVNMDCSITVNADGTFTLVTDKEYTGTWTFDSANVSYGFTRYSYDAAIDNSTDSVSMYLTSDNELSLSIYENDTSYCYIFAQMTEEEKAAFLKGPELLIGEYVSTSVLYEGSTDYVPETGYTMTVNADGTFTANVGETLTGTWSFEDLWERGMYYSLFIDGVDGSMTCSLMENGELTFYYMSSGSYTNVVFQKQ